MSQEERIIKGALDLFLQAGIKSVTMDDICPAFGYVEENYLSVFGDKNELVVALVKSRLQEDEREMNAIMESSANVIEEMIKMMKCSEEILSRVNPIVFHDMQKYHPEAWQEFQRFKAEVIIKKLEELLLKGINQGFIRNDIDVKILATMRVNQVEMGFNTQIFPIGHFNSWKVQVQLLEHFNYGICTIKGHELLDKYKEQNINN
jgi:AcrR family transcriptional regulator